MGEATFPETHPSFDRFLEAVDADLNVPEDGRVSSRNFRLDEGVPVARALSYAPGERFELTSFDTWTRGHSAYQADEVQRHFPVSGLPTRFDASDRTTCPETFAEPAREADYSGTLTRLDLVRVVRLGSLIENLGPLVDAAQILDDMRTICAPDQPSRTSLKGLGDAWARKQKRDEARAAITSAFLQWRPRIEPVWAAFWADVRDLLPNDEAPSADWPNRLRDRLGLAHLAGSPAAPLTVFVLRYKIERIAPLLGQIEERPLIVPTVLEAWLSAAFCPAPSAAAAGQLVNLDPAEGRTAREIVHPPIVWSADDVVRIGEITTPVASSLIDARRAHLRIVRKEWSPDYANATDADLL